MSFRVLGYACALLVLSGFSARLARAQSVYPMIMSVNPVAIEVGKTTVCEIRVDKNFIAPHTLDQAAIERSTKVLVTGEGIEATVLPPEPQTEDKLPPDQKKRARERVRIAITAAPDAQLGPRQLRFLAPYGASTLGSIVVVSDPPLSEAGDNDTIATAQPVALPATLCGAIDKAEDIDVYKFHATEGSLWTFCAHAAALQDVIYLLHEHTDLVLTLRDSRGTVLATNDNFSAADPLLTFRVPITGDYFLEVRDVRFSGNRDWFYAIEAHQRPYVQTLFPLQGMPGEQTDCRLIGFNLPDVTEATLRIPAAAGEGLQWITPELGEQHFNAAPVVVSNLPRLLEANRPNNTGQEAQPIAVPCAVNGRIEANEDVDNYVFQATAGECFSFSLIARRVQSSLDATLRVLNAAGLQQVANDDVRDHRVTSPDSRIDAWAAPADGAYVVEVQDVNLQGGPDAVYCLKVERAQPGFRLEVDGDKTLLGPGSSAAILVRAERLCGFDGEIALAVEGLPAGVQASCGKISPGSIDGCIILTADATATRDMTNVRVSGTGIGRSAKGGELKISAVAQSLEEIHMPGGSRGTYPVPMHTVSVNEAVDVRKVELDKYEVNLKPGGSETIGVTIERREGFDQGVAIDALYQHLEQVIHNCLPAGVTIDETKSQLYLKGKETKGTIVLTAAPDAKPIEKKQVPVMVHIALTFVAKYSLTAKPMFVSVTP